MEVDGEKAEDGCIRQRVEERFLHAARQAVGSAEAHLEEGRAVVLGQGGLASQFP